MATTDNQYYAEFEGRSSGPSTLGDNRFLTLEEVINNYMVLYADEENHGMNNRTKVEAFAKRAIQEYSYDTFRVKNWEYEVIDRATFPMPQDFVELIGINYVDANGTERWLQPRKDSSNPASPFQFDNTPVWDDETQYVVGDIVKYRTDQTSMDIPQNYDVYEVTSEPPVGTIPTDTTYWTQTQTGLTGYIYNSDGDILFYEDTSVTLDRFNSRRRQTTLLGGQQEDSTILGGYGYGSGTYGKRYWADPEKTNINPTYYVNERNGVIDLDPTLMGEVINLQYVSDGLSDDPAEIRVHKFSEQGIYESIYYEMIARSSRIPANEKQRAQKRMIASKRQTKLRLMNLSPRDIIQTLRSQAKWIKT